MLTSSFSAMDFANWPDILCWLPLSLLWILLTDLIFYVDFLFPCYGFCQLTWYSMLTSSFSAMDFANWPDILCWLPLSPLWILLTDLIFYVDFLFLHCGPDILCWLPLSPLWILLTDLIFYVDFLFLRYGFCWPDILCWLPLSLLWILLTDLIFYVDFLFLCYGFC